MEFLEVFTKWLKEKKFYIESDRFDRHTNRCEFVAATSEPEMAIYYGGYCEMCAYESTCITFKGTCTCKKKESDWTVEGRFELGQMIREMTELGKD